MPVPDTGYATVIKGGGDGDEDISGAREAGSFRSTVLCVRWRLRIPKRIVGLSLVAFSAFLFSVMSMLIKIAARTGVQPIAIAGYRGFGAFTFNAIWGIFVCKIPARELFGCAFPNITYKQRWTLVGRNISGTVSLASGFVAFTLLPLGDASALIFTSPIVTFMLARIFLKERIDLIDIACALICLVGVAFVARPEFLGFPQVAATAYSNASGTVFGNSTNNQEEMESVKITAASQHLSGLIAAFTAALASGTAYIFVRKLGKVRAEIVVSSFMLFAGITCSLVSIIVYKAEEFIIRDPVAFMAIIGVSLCGFGGQISMTKGFAIEKAGPAAVMRYIDVFFAFVWSSTILGESVSGWSVLGAIIIMISAATIAIKKMQRKKETEIPVTSESENEMKGIELFAAKKIDEAPPITAKPGIAVPLQEDGRECTNFDETMPSK